MEINLTEVFVLALMNSLYIIGIFEATQEGMILGGVGNLVRKLPEKLADPLLCCYKCMASVHGVGWLALYFHLFGYEWSLFWVAIGYVPMLSGITILVYELYSLMEKAKLYLTTRL